MTTSTPKGKGREILEIYDLGLRQRIFIAGDIDRAISQAVNEFADEAANEINDATECGEYYASKIRQLKAAYGKGGTGNDGQG